MPGVRISGIGTALPGTNVPGRIVTNDMLAEELRKRRECPEVKRQILEPRFWNLLPEGRALVHRQRWNQFETDHGWIESHTGIRERREAAPEIATSDLATTACQEALVVAGWQPKDIDFLIIATVTPDHLATPPTAALVQEKLGIPVMDGHGLHDIDGFDITCACSSFGKAFKVGCAYIASGFYRRGLVVGADVMSRIVNRYNRSVYPILGDGAGALALEQSSEENEDCFFGGRSFSGGLDGSAAQLIEVPVGGSRTPLTASVISDPFDQRHTIIMRGPPVKKRVERLLVPRRDSDNGLATTVIAAALKKLGRFSLPEIDFIALHQANLRINQPIETRLRELDFRGLVYHNIQRYGNTTSASIPLILWDAWMDRSLKVGDIVLSVVFGGGFSWETAIFRWTLPKPS